MLGDVVHDSSLLGIGVRSDETPPIGRVEVMRSLIAQLESSSVDARKRGVKRALALVRAGEDVSTLFASVIRSVLTDDMELKRLAYVFLTIYVQGQGEQAIMLVNTFVRDTENSNPLVRALAARNMSRVAIDVAEHFVVPLRRLAEDRNPFVRKTVALAIARLHHAVPEAVETGGLLTLLSGMVHDDNPGVVANACNAIAEVGPGEIAWTQTMVEAVLGALPSCSAWCQALLLDAVYAYEPSPAEAPGLVTRLIPVLGSNNAAVVIGVLRCLFKLIHRAGYETERRVEAFRRIVPQLVTVMSNTEPELQFVVLRTVRLFARRYHGVLASQFRAAFCKYNDRPWLRMEKVEVLLSLCNRHNVADVLAELEEYCNSVDVAFVRRVIQCVASIALRFDEAAPACADILTAQLRSRADYAVDEASVAVSLLLRRYPGRFEGMLQDVCSSLDRVRSSSGKAAAIWALGEFCGLIPAAVEVISGYLERFAEEPAIVQLQIVVASAKAYLENPEEGKELLGQVMHEALQVGVSPDVRNRALGVWRLLSRGAKAAEVLSFSKVGVSGEEEMLASDVVECFVENLGRVCGVLHMAPESFVAAKRPAADVRADEVLHVRKWTAVRTGSPAVDLLVDWSEDRLFVRLFSKSFDVVTAASVCIAPNALGLVARGEYTQLGLLLGQTVDLELELGRDGSQVAGDEVLGFTLSTNLGVWTGSGRLPIEVALVGGKGLRQEEFLTTWSEMGCSGRSRGIPGEVASDAVLAGRKVYVSGRSGAWTYACLHVGRMLILVEIESRDGDFVASVRGWEGRFLQAVTLSAGVLFGAAEG